MVSQLELIDTLAASAARNSRSRSQGHPRSLPDIDGNTSGCFAEGLVDRLSRGHYAIRPLARSGLRRYR